MAVLVVAVSAIGCGRDGNLTFDKGAKVQKAIANPTPKSSSDLPSGGKDVDSQIALRNLSILETYLRLRDGITPSHDAVEGRRLLSKFKLSLGQAREANVAIAQRSGQECRRYTALFNGLGDQLTQHFDSLLAGSSDLERQKYLIARVHILQFFERSLFAMLLTGSEAGESRLDPSVRKNCAAADRVVWTNILLRAHRDLEALSAHVVGLPSAMALTDEAQEMRVLAEREGRRNTFKKVAWVIGEIAASIAGWEKVVSPALNLFVDMASLTPTGRIIRFASGTVYLLGWVAFDRYAREMLPFLQSEPELIDRNVISNWERVMKLGEEFMVSHVASPPLYFAYVELLSLMRKETALQFINTNNEVLQKSEDQFGSIDKAVKHYKEVLNHELETENSGDRYDLERDSGMVANGQFH